MNKCGHWPFVVRHSGWETLAGSVPKCLKDDELSDVRLGSVKTMAFNNEQGPSVPVSHIMGRLLNLSEVLIETEEVLT